jgi:hypothetical protein
MPIYFGSNRKLVIICSVSVVLAALLALSCCDDETVRDFPRTVEDVPDTSPGDDPLADDLPSVLRRHLDVEFGNEDWVDDIEMIDSRSGLVRIQLDRDYANDTTAFDELCTAAAGFILPAGRYPATEVEVTDGNGEAAMRSGDGVPNAAQ